MQSDYFVPQRLGMDKESLLADDAADRQLLHPLQVSSESPVATSVRLQLLSVRALCRVIECCPERMAHWNAAVLDGIARLWVCLADSNEDAAGVWVLLGV